MQDADAMYEPTSDQQASGRIGPAKLFLHRQSAVGDVSIVGLRIESLSNFSSARAGTAVFKVGMHSVYGVSVPCRVAPLAAPLQCVSWPANPRGNAISFL